MRKSLGFIVLVSLLLLLAACQPKTATPEKKVIVGEEVDAVDELDGETFADIEDFTNVFVRVYDLTIRIQDEHHVRDCVREFSENTGGLEQLGLPTHFSPRRTGRWGEFGGDVPVHHDAPSFPFGDGKRRQYRCTTMT